MAGHGWLTRAENALTSSEVNADNLYYVKLAGHRAESAAPYAAMRTFDGYIIHARTVHGRVGVGKLKPTRPGANAATSDWR